LTEEQTPEDGYCGPATLTIGSARFDVRVELRGHFEPIDGRYHWYGRIAKDEGLAALLRGSAGAGVIDTGYGTSLCEFAEPDLWDRYRITGYSTPPFPAT
jgi:hypothetical protein